MRASSLIMARRTGRLRATLASTVYKALRDDIVSVRRFPGAPISDGDLMGTYGVSRTPVREAILRLADEDLVDVFPQSGTFVAKIPIAELPEALRIRTLLEEEVVRTAARKATRRGIMQLKCNLEGQVERCGMSDGDGFHVLDEEFHFLLAEIAGCPRFWTSIQQVKTQVDRFRRLTLSLRVPGHVATVVEEHRALLAAIEAGDPERAAKEIRAHVAGLMPNMESARRAFPECFVKDREM